MINIKKIELLTETESRWFGMDDYHISLVTGKHIVKLKYVSEPPHGDSYHELLIDGRAFHGYVWGCSFLFPGNQRYMVCSWMERTYERKTIIINLENMKYYTFEKYWYDFKDENGILILGNDKFSETMQIDIESIEKWREMK